MLEKLVIYNFRKVVHAEMVFTQGLNVIRGNNEASKTTRLEAFNYALFGVKGIRSPLDEVVTWGLDPKSLKVQAVFNGYEITRSKAGAEVKRGSTVLVTGQAEVTKFCEELLGADAKVAGQLMLSGQNGLRGVLEEGPKATAQTIENLANFELFDRILEAATERLQLGATAPLAERTRLLTQQLGELPQAEVPNESSYRFRVAEYQGIVDRRNDALHNRLLPEQAAATQAWRDAYGVRDKVSALERDLLQVQVSVDDTNAKIKVVQATASETLPELDKLEAALAVAKADADTRKAWAAFNELPVVKNSVSRADWEAEVTSTENQKIKAQAEINTFKADIRILENKKVTETACGLCGKDLSDVPEVVHKNAELDRQIDELRVKVAAHAQVIERLTTDLTFVPKTRDMDNKLRNQAQGLGSAVTVDLSVIPAQVAWVGPAVSSEVPDLAKISADVANAKDSHRRILAAIAQLEAHQSTLVAVNQRVKTLENEIQALAPVSDEKFAELEAAHLLAGQCVQIAESERDQALARIAELQNDYAERVRQAEHAERNRQVMKDQIAQVEKDIATIEFNNTLVKKVRAARPIIANKLWNMVLSSVSQLFSRMRGEQSVVTRGDSGFLVNGHSIGGLSGSTLDILGLAVRTALVRTFIPGCQLMVLDEPAASMDDSRTTSLLGMVVSSGFEQTILITHEDISEAFAANLIQL